MKLHVPLLIVLVLAALPCIDALRAEGLVTSDARVLAQAKPGKKPAASDTVDKSEAGVLEFVREHHPELAGLLESLKENRPKEYQKAIRDLTRVRDRLANINDKRRYELELAIWKTESRIQLLAARLQMGDKDELRDQLREALNEQIDLKVSLLKHERDQARQRLERMETQLQKLDEDRSQVVQRQLDVLTRQSETTSAKEPVKKPAAKRPYDKQPPEKITPEKKPAKR